ncbi:MAG: hypothetical protein VX963_08700 [Actinomycetota bacterium]|jgi:homoserine kinase|nr:hypothetical protein [Acidimicrobiaceae bacterium]MEC7916339.1 hypothetical protein [Actinomycetota bacterium]MEC9059962.1 hypothetical protein [Actinomycetota bacterium]MED5361579.1 hypothetical protein [Actinomycetota bacterium]
MRVTVPASSANIGAGFDCLAVALDLPFHLDVDEPRGSSVELDPQHPAAAAFAQAGGSGALFAETSIPPGKGFGFSGSARVAGLAAASLQQSGSIHFPDLLKLSGKLEGHYDNVAASIYGSVTATTGNSVVRLKCPSQLEVLVWIPDSKTSTNASRRHLPSSVSLEVATRALARSSVLVAAIASSDLAAIRECCRDDLHQPTRLATQPDSGLAIESALESGACGAWLSGSGPAVAAFVEQDHVDSVREAFPSSGHSKLLKVAQHGISVS